MRCVALLILACASLSGQGNSRALLLNSVSAGGGGGGTPAFVQAQSGTDVAQLSIPITPTAGNTLIACLGTRHASGTQGISGIVNGAFALMGSRHQGTNNTFAETYACFCKAAVSGSAETVQDTSVGGGDARTVVVAEFSNLVCTTDGEDFANGTGTAMATATGFTTTNAADVIISFGYDSINASSAITAGNLCGSAATIPTNGSSAAAFGFQYRVVSATQTGCLATMTNHGSSLAWELLQLAFKNQ